MRHGIHCNKWPRLFHPTHFFLSCRYTISLFHSVFRSLAILSFVLLKSSSARKNTHCTFSWSIRHTCIHMYVLNTICSCHKIQNLDAVAVIGATKTYTVATICVSIHGFHLFPLFGVVNKKNSYFESGRHACTLYTTI